MTNWTVCPECLGDGKVVHPALSVWTESDRHEDPEGFENMMRGDYDRVCETCRGLRVVDQEEWESKAEERAEWREDARIRAMESGDPEAYYNPDLYRY